MSAKTFYLDELKGGSGPGNRGADFAVFRSPGTLPQPVDFRIGWGEYKLYTSDWIKRGRPTYIIIDVPDPEEQP